MVIVIVFAGLFVLAALFVHKLCGSGSGRHGGMRVDRLHVRPPFFGPRTRAPLPRACVRSREPSRPAYVRRGQREPNSPPMRRRRKERPL